MKRIIPIIIAIVLCVLQISVFADNSNTNQYSEPKTLRVGYYKITNYQDYDSSNEHYGYVFDYLSKISQYANWKYEFVDADFYKCMEMLKNGEVDIVSCIDKNRTDANFYDFSALEMSSMQYKLFALKTRTDLNFNNYKAFDKKKVALLKGTYQEVKLDNYATENNISFNKKYYDNEDALKNALKTGEVDLAYSVALNSEDDLNIVGSFPEVNLYFALTKGSPFLADLNSAMEYIKITSLGFNYRLNRKYSINNSMFVPDFTDEELEYIKNAPEIKVVYDPNWSPIESYDKDSDTSVGISHSVLDLISKYSGLRFTYINTSSFSESRDIIKNGDADIISGITADYNWGNSLNLYISSPYLNANMVQIKKDINSSAEDGTIALPKDFYITQYIKSIYGDKDKIVEYPTFEDCLYAVEYGDADITYANSYSAYYYLSSFKYSDLISHPLSETQQNISIGVSKTANPLLLKIIDKSLVCVSNTQIDDITFSNNIQNDEYNIKTLIHHYPDIMYGAFGLILLFLVAILLFSAIYVRSKMHASIVKEDIRFGKVLTGMYSSVYNISFNEYHTKIEDLNENGISMVHSENVGIEEHTKMIAEQKVHKDDQAMYINYFSTENLLKLHMGETLFFDCQTLDETGKYRWFMYMIQEVPPSSRDKEKLHRILICKKDIDESKRKEILHQRQLIDALAIAEKSSKAKDEFLSRMSHEIRTPLNAIIGFTRLSNENINNKEKIKDYLKKTDYASQHLLNLINDILDISKIESGKLQIIKEDFNILNVLDTISATSFEKCENDHINFMINIDKHIKKSPILIGDSMRLKQILLNIVSNALKYSHNGGRVTLDVNYSSEDNNNVFVSFVVSDDGIGMSEGFKNRLFKPFEQQDEYISREYGGSGLGMSIVKNLVNIMNGSINVDSEEGVGTTITIDLPFEIYSENKTEQKENKTKQDLEISKILKGKKILIAEDNKLNEEIINEIITSRGIISDVASDGLEALEKFKEKPEYYYDMILMDVQMPNMDGYTATRNIRKLNRPDASSIPIIAMTAHTFKNDVSEALSSGMNGHISKPLDIDKMFDTICNIFDQNDRNKN